MDDRRFDALVKALARDGSRRSMLKGLLGLGGAAVAGGALLESGAEAARRPAPTPKPVKCPGRQTWDGNACVCYSPPAPGIHVCGPDCCNGLPGDPPSTTHSECCDNACCFGTCYGEELCCPTNLDASSGLASYKVCEDASGSACCEIDQYCCPVDGGMSCSDIPCDEPDGCDLCESADDCCFINDQFVACVDLTVLGNCCTAATCELEDLDNCLTSACIDFECQQVSTCAPGDICCAGECVTGEICPQVPV